MEHLQQVWLASRERLPFRLLFMIPVLPKLPYLFLDFHLEYPRYFLDFAYFFSETA